MYHASVVIINFDMRCLYSLNNDYNIAVGVLSTKDVKSYLGCMYLGIILDISMGVQHILVTHYVCSQRNKFGNFVVEIMPYVLSSDFLF